MLMQLPTHKCFQTWKAKRKIEPIKPGQDNNKENIWNFIKSHAIISLWSYILFGDDSLLTA